MKFPNAYEGVKKLFTSEILKLIGYVCIFGAGISMLFTVLSGMSLEAAGTGLILTIVFFVGFIVLSVISIILQLIGLKRAGKDESDFEGGFIMAVFSLILVVVSVALSTINGGNNVFDDIAQGISEILHIGVMLYVSRGVANLADKLHDTKIAGTGRNIYMLYSVILMVGVILRLVSSIFRLNTEMSIASVIILLISGILSIIAYIIYVVFLGRAKKMLQE